MFTSHRSLTLFSITAFIATGATAFATAAVPVNYADWISHKVHLVDTRPLGKVTQPHPCDLEVIELKYDSPLPKAGAALLIPGLFHGAAIFDVLPEENVSYARWLMRTKGLQVYLFQARGEGGSCYPGYSSLDDIVIDDIPNVINYVADTLEKEKIFVFGHSQGGITLQASLAGLTRCSDGLNCFKPEVAQERQRRVKSAAFMAGNAAMSTTQKNNSLLTMALLDDTFGNMLTPIVDRIPATLLTKDLSPTVDNGGSMSGEKSLAYASFWEAIYHVPNVTHDARRAFYDRTLDSSTFEILDQYSRGIQFGGIAATSGQKYIDHFDNIRVPSVTGTFELDTLSDSDATLRDDYSRIGSVAKAHFFFAGEGHEDYALNSAFHEHQSGLWDWMLQNAQ